MRACAFLLLFLTLGGCSLSNSFPDQVSNEVDGPPVNYRYTIANELPAIMGAKEPNSRFLEITPPRLVDKAKGAIWMVGIKPSRFAATRGAIWMVCVKALRYPSRTPQAYYAVFIQNDKMLSSRLSVVLDQCESQTYSPFEWTVDVDNPVTWH